MRKNVSLLSQMIGIKNKKQIKGKQGTSLWFSNMYLLSNQIEYSKHPIFINDNTQTGMNYSPQAKETFIFSQKAETFPPNICKDGDEIACVSGNSKDTRYTHVSEDFQHEIWGKYLKNDES